MWYQLEISNCANDKVALLSEALEQTGALSITMTDKNDDAILEPEIGSTPLWPETLVVALYDTEMSMENAHQMVQEQFTDLSCQLSHLEDKDWERVWMDDFKPQCFGTRLWICPSWATPPEPNAVNLILDPGLAFGTGTHPTTSLCLQWLDQNDVQNKTVTDYGCGSGILALAALKLGAKQVEAVDIDPQALIATQNNAENNQLYDINMLKIGFPESLDKPVDLILANILLLPLLSLKERFMSLLKPQGILVISGILSEQEDQLISSYSPQLECTQQLRENGWSVLVFSK